MPNFTQRIQTADGCFDISFQETSPEESNEYLITIVEDDYTAPPFLMRLTSGGWRVLDGTYLPMWVQALENVLQHTLLQSAVTTV